MGIDSWLTAVALLVLLAAAYIDVKTKEIPDWLNFSLLATALGWRSIAATTQGFSILLSGIIGLAICLLIALFFYYTNQWGGGDSKLLMAMGAVIGVSWPPSKDSWALLWFLLLLLFIGTIWGIIWMIGVAVKKKQLFELSFKHSLQNHKYLHLILALFTGLMLILTIVFRPSVFVSLVWLLAIISLPLFYLFLFVGAVEKSCFYTRKKPPELMEGDWLAQDVVVKGRKVITKRSLSKDDLTFLRELKNKITTVLIKEGIPFVPSFLFSFIIVAFFEKYIYALLKALF